MKCQLAPTPKSVLVLHAAVGNLSGLTRISAGRTLRLGLNIVAVGAQPARSSGELKGLNVIRKVMSSFMGMLSH